MRLRRMRSRHQARRLVACHPPNPESRIPESPKSRIPNSESRIPNPESLIPNPLSRRGTGLSAPLLFFHHGRNVRGELLRVVGNAVLDRPLDAANALDAAGLVV